MNYKDYVKQVNKCEQFVDSISNSVSEDGVQRTTVYTDQGPITRMVYPTQKGESITSKVCYEGVCRRSEDGGYADSFANLTFERVELVPKSENEPDYYSKVFDKIYGNIYEPSRTREVSCSIVEGAIKQNDALENYFKIVDNLSIAISIKIC